MLTYLTIIFIVASVICMALIIGLALFQISLKKKNELEKIEIREILNNLDHSINMLRNEMNSIHTSILEDIDLKTEVLNIKNSHIQTIQTMSSLDEKIKDMVGKLGYELEKINQTLSQLEVEIYEENKEIN